MLNLCKNLEGIDLEKGQEEGEETDLFELDNLVNAHHTISVKANYAQAEKLGRYFAISDSGADSTVV